jgi:sugar-specific transcriptional regulator TrmB
MRDQLKKLGLSDGEASVYIYLANKNNGTVSQISKFIKTHRTTVYEFLEKLENKGLVSHILINNTKTYSITNPIKLKDYIDEKREIAENIIKTIKDSKKIDSKEPIIEIHKGKEGIKYLMNDLIRTKKDYVCTGVNEEDWEKRFDIETAQHIQKEKKAGITWRGIISNDQTIVYKVGNYKSIDREHFLESPILIYGDNVAQIIWEPLTLIIIRNPQLAQAHKKHFELMWKIAKKPKIKKLI